MAMTPPVVADGRVRLCDAPTGARDARRRRAHAEVAVMRSAPRSGSARRASPRAPTAPARLAAVAGQQRAERFAGCRAQNCRKFSSRRRSARYARSSRSIGRRDLGRGDADARGPGEAPVPSDGAADRELIGVDELAVDLRLLSVEADVGDPVLAAAVRAAGDVDPQMLVESGHAVLQALDQPAREPLRLGEGELAELRARAGHGPAEEGRPARGEAGPAQRALQGGLVPARHVENEEVLHHRRPQHPVRRSARRPRPPRASGRGPSARGRWRAPRRRGPAASAGESPRGRGRRRPVAPRAPRRSRAPPSRRSSSARNDAAVQPWRRKRNFSRAFSRFSRSTSLSRKIADTAATTSTAWSHRTKASSRSPKCGSVERPPPTRREKPISSRAGWRMAVRPDVVDLGIGAPHAATADRDLVLAGQIVELGIAVQEIGESRRRGRRRRRSRRRRSPPPGTP